MGRNLRRMPVKLDPEDHGYGRALAADEARNQEQLDALKVGMAHLGHNAGVVPHTIHTTATELGRKVKIDDWIGFHRDRLLSVLYTMRDAGNDDGLTIEQIRGVTGLSSSQNVWDLVVKMKSLNLVETSSINNTTVITERGIRWVEESPKQP